MPFDINAHIRRENYRRYALQCSLAGGTVLALGIVLNEWNLLTLAVVLTGVILLSLVKQIIMPHLLDLA